MRLLPGNECARVYSYLGLDRAPHKCDEGFGIGVLAPGWDSMSSPAGVHFGDAFTPDRIPGCQLFCCTDTSAYPTAVVFPADPTVNGNFEGADGNPPDGWTKLNATCSRQAGTRTGGTGSYVGRMAYDGSNAVGYLYQNRYAIGNLYDLDVWLRTDGVGVPELRNDTTTLWTGSASATWQHAVVSGATTPAGSFVVRCANLAAGRYVEVDDFTVTPRNASQLTDLTGLGHHLVQATASKQPLWVASGAGGVLRFDGSADYSQTGAFTLAQPTTLFLLSAYTKKGTATYLTDGVGGTNLGVITHNGVADSMISFCGTSLLGPAFTTGQPYVIDTCFNAASSYVALNGGTKTTGQTGAGAPSMGGVTIGAAGNGAVPSIADVYAVVVYNRVLSEPERQRVVRYLRRLGARLGVVIP